MRVAFYAPLNPPEGATPSGDRLIAGMLMRALRAAGHDVGLASRFRTFDRAGDASRQSRLAGLGARIAKRLVRRMADEPPEVWLTYHLYHKAPDYLGPTVTAELGIPYAVVEASVTPSAAAGQWAQGHRMVIHALGRADLVIGINPKDREGVLRCLNPRARYAETPVFIDGAPYRVAGVHRDAHRRNFLAQTGARPETTLLLAVGMMRSPDKLASYRVLAEALAHIADRDWHLAIAGDGPLMVEARALFAPLGARITFLGRVPYDRLPALYAGADLLVWPAIKEALGMCFLEAQASGTPVVGADRPGVASLIDDGTSGLLPPYADPVAFANAIASLIGDRPRLVAMRAAASRHTYANHDMATAGPRFAALVSSLVKTP